MHPLSVQPPHVNSTLLGAVITRDLPTDGRTFRKGDVITDADLPQLRTADQAIHAALLSPDETHERDAAIRLATAIRGDGTAQREPVQSRVNVTSAHRGLLRIDTDALRRLNRLGDISIFTSPDALPVDADSIVAGVKITPVAMPTAVLDQALARLSGAVITVLPFRPLRVGTVVTERLEGRVRDRFETTLMRKMNWFGADLLPIRYVPERLDEIVAAITDMRANGIDLLLTAGGHMLDPLDATQLSLPHVNARLVRLGAPAHPGSMFWIGAFNDSGTPIVSLASCSMFSRSTVADLVLPRVFAGETVTSDDLADLGHGGLLDRDMQWRFPPYPTDAP